MQGARRHHRGYREIYTTNASQDWKRSEATMAWEATGRRGREDDKVTAALTLSVAPALTA